MDDVGKTIKNIIFRKVNSGQIVVHTLKGFSDAAMKFMVSSIVTVYLPKSDEILESESIYQAPFIPETLSVLKFVRQINDREDSIIEFFKKAVDQEAFHIQRYKKLVMFFVVTRSPIKTIECSTCRKWYIEDRSEWLQCPICEQ